MYKSYVQILITCVLYLFVITNFSVEIPKNNEIETRKIQLIQPYIPEEPLSEPEVVVSIEKHEVPRLTKEVYSGPKYSEEEIELLAFLMMGEAEGECEQGQRLVIDTVLNRIDDPHFPNTIREVIYQKNQFSAMWTDRFYRTYVTDEAIQLVREELVSRTNYDVVFFTAGNYGRYGTPIFQVGNHYFCSYY